MTAECMSRDVLPQFHCMITTAQILLPNEVTRIGIPDILASFLCSGSKLRYSGHLCLGQWLGMVKPQVAVNDINTTANKNPTQKSQQKITETNVM